MTLKPLHQDMTFMPSMTNGFHGGTTWGNPSLKALLEPLLAFAKNGTSAAQYADS
jgi:hypothetical protein